jgi:Ca2+-binding RTX toxin-like protein
LEVLVAEDTYNAGEGAVVRQGRSIALVVAFLIGCAVVLMAGASGVQAEASKKEEARCEGPRTYRSKVDMIVYTTNDLPGCPKGGLLSGTDKPDNLAGKHGDDEIRGLGASDTIEGGDGNDVIYGGPGRDFVFDGNGEDVLYLGAGNDDVIVANGVLDDGTRDKLYCGPGKDEYLADKDKKDYVDSSCEEELPHHPPPDPGDFISTPPKAGEDGAARAPR